MPFRHLTVLDLATLGAAPQIASFFGDFGARVIKIEHPRGDGLRQLVDPKGVALQWKIINRNKECVTLDASQSAGRELLGRMLERADLLVTNSSGERLQRWSLGHEKLRENHPRLVHVNLTAYGISGPWATRPGSGTLAEAATGLASLTGASDGPPTLSPVGLGDFVGVLEGTIAALVGLYQRDRTDPSRPRSERTDDSFFDVSMCRPLLALLSHRIATASRDQCEPGRHGNRFPNAAPRNTYRAADGRWIALTAGTDDLARRLLQTIAPELADDPHFSNNLARVANVEELDAIIGAWVGARPAQQAIDILTGAAVSAAECSDLLDVAENPHFRARGELKEFSDDGEPLRLTSPLPPAAIRWLGRELAADNAAVYCEWLGLSANELDELRHGGVV